ncbi:MAG: hypothetical protein KBA31_13020 [Alphaproteobacteria bacterium]|nr:hypothetical protein [Alphaproteobacteria bacterium]
MHSFTGLADSCASFTLSALNEVNDKTIAALQTSGATALVRSLQMVQLQKAILAVGMFSLFDGILQGELGCADGFGGAAIVLEREGRVALQEEFSDYQKAINVLKHGRGRSYDALVAKANQLPFRVLLPTEAFFYEGDVGEIATLIEVDDKFVLRCGELIREVSEALKV